MPSKHVKLTMPVGGQGWGQRYNMNGDPITIDQAHGNGLSSNPLSPLIRVGGPVGVFLGAVLYSTSAY